ncbi:MAG TPA: hypothetical protein VKQ52_18015 [Puia sp.]|nr:hypothetical protein [Puia sp.]
MMRYAVLALLTSLLLTNCSKNNSSTNSQGTLSATVGSSAFTANQTFGAYYSSLSTMTVIGLVPQGKDSTILQLSLPYPLTVDTTRSSDNTSFGLSYYTRSGSKSYDAFAGNGHAIFNISLFDTVNHKLSGTFSGTLLNDLNPSTDSVVITNGKFTTAYSVQ